jgi:hypothetical protein
MNAESNPYYKGVVVGMIWPTGCLNHTARMTIVTVCLIY